MKNRSFQNLLLCLALTSSVGGTAGAQIAGFKISTPVVTVLDTQNAEAEFDVIAYGQTLSTPPQNYVAGIPLNNSSSTIFTNSYSFGNGMRPYQVRLAVDSQWNITDKPALEFGDGARLQTIVLPLDPGTASTGTLTASASSPSGLGGTVFRGSFTHNYGNGTHTVTARLTPRGMYASPSPGVNVASTLTTGNPMIADLSNTFVYQVTVSPLSPPGTGTYTFQSTSTISNTFPSTVVAVTNTEVVDVMLPAPTVTVDGGVCPGVLNVDITGLTPGARFTFWAADSAGAFPIPTGPCSGTIVDLDTDAPRRADFADKAGEFSFTRFFFPDQCDVLMQAVNHGNCTKSAIVTPPIPPEISRSGLQAGGQLQR